MDWCRKMVRDVESFDDVIWMDESSEVFFLTATNSSTMYTRVKLVKYSINWWPTPSETPQP